MISTTVYGMELNISCRTLDAQESIDISSVINELVSLYKDFDSDKKSYPLSLDPFYLEGKKSKFKKNGDVFSSKTKYYLAHWYICSDAEYLITSNSTFTELPYKSFAGDKVYFFEHIDKDLKFELLSSGDSICEKTGFFWHDGGKLQSEIIDISLLEFDNKFSPKSKVIKDVGNQLISKLLGSSKSEISNIRRVILMNGATTIDLLRDGQLFSSTTTKNGVEASPLEKSCESPSVANAQIDETIKNLLNEGFEVVNDMSM